MTIETLRKRLTAYKAKAANPYIHGSDWRDHVSPIVTVYNRATCYPRDHIRPSWRHCRWIEDVEAAGLRFADYADKINKGIHHTGWYTDEDGSNGESLRGAVYRLPSRDGQEVFVYGYNDPNIAGAAFLCFDNDATDLHHAANLADQLAQRVAEDEREYQAKEEAQCTIEEAALEIKAAGQSILRLIREAKANCAALAAMPEAKAAVRDKVQGLLDLRRKAARRRAMTENYL